jgi:secondary thiamine-phosphate synthase enzyme
MIYRIPIKTESIASVVSLTEDVKKIVEESGVKSGICMIYSPHTTAALTVTSFWDPKGFEDIQDEIGRLIPTRIDFKHQHDTPQDAAGHVKSSLIGISLSFIIEESELFVGHSQGIYFLEFDGPRNRECFVKIIKEN